MKKQLLKLPVKIISHLKNLQNWKKILLDNTVITMDLAKAVKEYKQELIAVQEENEMLTKIVGKMTVEKEWLEKS